MSDRIMEEVNRRFNLVFSEKKAPEIYRKLAALYVQQTLSDVENAAMAEAKKLQVWGSQMQAKAMQLIKENDTEKYLKDETWPAHKADISVIEKLVGDAK